jgi:hypothetical protein
MMHKRVLFALGLGLSAACGDGDRGEPAARTAALTESEISEPFDAEDLFGVALQSAPGVVQDGGRRLALYVGPNGHLWQSTHDGSWWGAPADLGGVTLTSAPSVVVTSPGRYRVLYRGPNGHLWQSSFDGTWWGAPADLGGVTLTSGPSAVVTAPGRIRALYRGPNGHLWQSSFDGTWWGAPADLGGVTITDAPSVVAPLGQAGTLRAFYRGPNDHLWQSTYDGTWWGAPMDLGGVALSSAPSAVSSRTGRVDVFYLGPGGELMSSQLDPAAGWSAPYRHAVTARSAPGALSAWEVYYRGASDHLTVSYPRAVVKTILNQGRTRWVGAEAGDLGDWCLGSRQVRYGDDLGASRTSELHLFARDPGSLATRLAGLDDAAIRAGQWTAEAATPDPTARVAAMPYPPNASFDLSRPVSVSLNTPMFYGGALPSRRNGETSCLRPGRGTAAFYEGGVRGAAIYQHGACAARVDTGEKLAQIGGALFDRFRTSDGISDAVDVYTKTHVALRREEGDEILPGFLLAFHYDATVAGWPGNDVSGTFEYRFGLDQGVLALTRVTEHRTQYGGLHGLLLRSRLRDALQMDLPQEFRAQAQAQQEVVDIFSGSCAAATDCAGSAEALASLITAAGLGEVGIPGATQAQIDRARCAVGSAAACARLGRTADLTGRWSCQQPAGSCAFRLPAKRLNGKPDELELVWYDGPELDNPAFAFAAAAGAKGRGQLCSAPPRTVAVPPGHRLLTLAQTGVGP